MLPVPLQVDNSLIRNLNHFFATGRYFAEFRILDFEGKEALFSIIAGTAAFAFTAGRPPLVFFAGTGGFILKAGSDMLFPLVFKSLVSLALAKTSVKPRSFAIVFRDSV